MIEVEQAAEPFTANDPNVRVGGLGTNEDQPVSETLMISLAMVVIDELADHPPQMSFATSNSRSPSSRAGGRSRMVSLVAPAQVTLHV